MKIWRFAQTLTDNLKIIVTRSVSEDAPIGYGPLRPLQVGLRTEPYFPTSAIGVFDERSPPLTAYAAGQRTVRDALATGG